MFKVIKLVLILGSAMVISILLAVLPSRLQHDPQLGWIAYTTDSQYYNNRAAKIHVMWLDGKTSHIVNRQFHRILSLSWSPDGRDLAFLAAGDTTVTNRRSTYFTGLYLMRADGRNLRKLAQFDDVSIEGGDVIWSGDGDRIVFSTFRQGGTQNTFRIRRDGNHMQQLQGIDRDSIHWQAVNEPEQIIPIGDDGGDYSRMVAQLYQHPGPYSPDRQWAIYIPLEGDRQKIFRFALSSNDTAPTSQEPELLLEAPDEVDLFPSWSRDSNHIWFTTRRGEEPGSNLYHYSITADTLSLIMSSDTHHFTPSSWMVHDQMLFVSARMLDGRGTTDGYLVSDTNPETASPIRLPLMANRNEGLGNMSWKPNPDHTLQWGKLLAILIGGLGLALVIHRYSN